MVLWRPEALDCRVLIPPEAWSWLTRGPWVADTLRVAEGVHLRPAEPPAAHAPFFNNNYFLYTYIYICVYI